MGYPLGSKAGPERDESVIVRAERGVFIIQGETSENR